MGEPRVSKTTGPRTTIRHLRMPYINERGEILESRPLWRIGTITEFFQGLARMASLFFQSLFMLDTSNSSRSSNSWHGSGSRSGRGPPAPPRRRMGGFGSSADAGEQRFIFGFLLISSFLSSQSHISGGCVQVSFVLWYFPRLILKF